MHAMLRKSGIRGMDTANTGQSCHAPSCHMHKSGAIFGGNRAIIRIIILDCGGVQRNAGRIEGSEWYACNPGVNQAPT